MNTIAGKSLIESVIETLRTLIHQGQKAEKPPQPAGTASLLQPEDISPAGLDLVMHFESLFLKAYKDTGGIWTIGWGHTGLQHNDGTVYKGRIITRAEAERLLSYDMNQFEARVHSLVKVPLAQHEFDAVVSFDFNSGGLTLDDGKTSKPSTFLKLLNANAGKRAQAADELLKWVHDDGRKLAGLVRRRNAERAMFLGQSWEQFRK